MTTSTDQWARPTEIDDISVAFPANVGHLMPDIQTAEDALRALPDRGKKWIEFQSRWFFSGLPRGTSVTPKDGIDLTLAMRHLGAIQRSFEPQHEHKEAAVAYLASRWFDDVKYEGD